MPITPPKLALILSGGGARAAYQAGVAKAIAEHLPAGSPSPFKIVSGTSAGGINAAALASGARDIHEATSVLCKRWSDLSVRDICRVDGPHLAMTGWRLMRSMFPGASWQQPLALLDNAPLAALLARVIQFPAI